MTYEDSPGEDIRWSQGTEQHSRSEHERVRNRVCVSRQSYSRSQAPTSPLSPKHCANLQPDASASRTVAILGRTESGRGECECEIEIAETVWMHWVLCYQVGYHPLLSFPRYPPLCGMWGCVQDRWLALTGLTACLPCSRRTLIA